MCYYNPLHRSRRFINQYFRLTDQNAKLFTRNHDMCFADKSARMRPGCSRWSAAWSKHWRQCVWLTCQTRTRDTLASRCSKRAARKPPRCGTGDRAKNTHCELSSFGPTLFEIWWPDIYLGGPYGPVTDKMYWPELVRRSEKCAGPAGQRASAYVEGCLFNISPDKIQLYLSILFLKIIVLQYYCNTTKICALSRQ